MPSLRGLAAVLVCASVAIGGCNESGDATAQSSEDITAGAGLFASKDAFPLELEGAFSAAFAAAHAGEPSGPLPGMPVRKTDDFPGKLRFTTPSGEVKTLDVIFKVRGNSSLAECSFAKLSLKLTPEAKVAARGTVFEKQPKLKIGTHCDEARDDENGTVGRLRNEKSPLREVYAYNALAAVLPTTLTARASKITYVDTAAGTTLTRSAMLLENIETLAKRSDAPEHCRDVDGEEECDPVLTDSEVAAADPRNGMDRVRIAAITLFHVAIGNWDWRLDVGPRANGSRLWNTEVLLMPTPLAVAHDFDLASAVTGRIRRQVPTSAQLSEQAIEFLRRTEGLTPAEVSAAKALFREKKADLYAVADAAVIDEPGRANARAHLDAFFAAIGD